MKRILAVALLIFLVVPMVAFANEPFVFRGVLKWGMPKEEVAALLEGEGLVLGDSSEDKNHTFYYDVPVGEHIAQSLALSCGEEGLRTIGYYFPRQPASDIEALHDLYFDLLEGLTRVYGEPKTSSPNERAGWEFSDVNVTLWVHYGVNGTDENQCKIIYSRPKEINTSGL